MGLIQGISRSIINLLPRGIADLRSSNSILAAIAAAKRSLGLHSNYDAAQALLVSSKPQLDGTVVDEIAGHSAGALGGKASTFSGAETIPLGVATPANTIMSSGVWVKTITGGSIFAYTDYSVQGFTLGINSGVFRVIVRESSAGNYKDYRTTVALNDGDWHLILYTFAGGVLRLYVDGVEATSLTKSVDDSVTTIGAGDDAWHRVSGYGPSPLNEWTGQVQYPMRWDGYELTDHEIAMLADSMTLPSTAPDFLGYLIGD